MIEEKRFPLTNKEFDLSMDGLSRDELVDLKNDLESDMDGIRMQLEDAKTDLITEGKYADRDWYVRANRALKIKGRHCQRIQQRLGKLKANKPQVLRPLAECFMDVARETLDTGLFQEILEDARAKVNMLATENEEPS